MKFTNPNLNPNMLLGFKTNFNFNLKFLNPSNILEFRFGFVNFIKYRICTGFENFCKYRRSLCTSLT